MFKNCLIVVVLFATVACQEFDELDEQVLLELQENQQSQILSNGLLKADDKQFDGKSIFFYFLFLKVSFIKLELK